MFLAVTSTPGIKAPLESPTVPLRTAFTCQNADIPNAKQNSTPAVTMSFLIYLNLPLFNAGDFIMRYRVPQAVQYRVRISNCSWIKEGQVSGTDSSNRCNRRLLQ